MRKIKEYIKSEATSTLHSIYYWSLVIYNNRANACLHGQVISLAYCNFDVFVLFLLMFGQCGGGTGRGGRDWWVGGRRSSRNASTTGNDAESVN